MTLRTSTGDILDKKRVVVGICKTVIEENRDTTRI